MNIKNKLKLYIDSYLNPKVERKAKFSQFPVMDECTVGASSINNYINDNKEDTTFQTELFKLIDSKELKDSDVYNKVNIDRRLFSKIRSNKDYHPSKETVILLGIALELTEDELENLLSLSSYSLPMNNTFDLIIRFCFKEKIFDINQINEFLYDYNCKTLN